MGHPNGHGLMNVMAKKKLGTQSTWKGVEGDKGIAAKLLFPVRHHLLARHPSQKNLDLQTMRVIIITTIFNPGLISCSQVIMFITERTGKDIS